MLNKDVRKKLSRLEGLIQKESTVPLVNRLLGDTASEKLTHTWMYKSWGDLAHSDLVEKGDALHYRRVLKKAREETIHEVKRFLDKNVYADMVMDLVLQSYDEQRELGKVDALFLLELTYELARVEKGVPVQTGLLNLIYKNKEEFGTIELLKQSERPKEKYRREVFDEVEVLSSYDTDSSEIPPMDNIDATLNASAALGLKQNQLDVKRGDMSHLPKLTHEYEENGMTDSQLLNSGPMVDELKKHEKIEEMAKMVKIGGRKSESRNREVLIAQWEELEESVTFKVSTLLNDSLRMKELKKQLWERQQYAERILDFTEECCEEEETKSKYHREMMKMRPIFRGEMGKKISARPEIADKVYNILDAMMDMEVSAFEYIHLAVALAKNPYDIAVSIIECDLTNDGGLYDKVDDIIATLEGFDERCKGMPAIAAKAISERQSQLWEYASR